MIEAAIETEATPASPRFVSTSADPTLQALGTQFARVG
jgi:hypothetical protein